MGAYRYSVVDSMQLITQLNDLSFIRYLDYHYKCITLSTLWYVLQTKHNCKYLDCTQISNVYSMNIF